MLFLQNLVKPFTSIINNSGRRSSVQILKIKPRNLEFSSRSLSINPEKMPGQLQEQKVKRATFGMGCFWAGDALFGVTPGVIRTCVGYASGSSPSPTYKNM